MEGESELVSGFNVEYAAGPFALCLGFNDVQPIRCSCKYTARIPQLFLCARNSPAIEHSSSATTVIGSNNKKLKETTVQESLPESLTCDITEGEAISLEKVNSLLMLEEKNWSFIKSLKRRLSTPFSTTTVHGAPCCVDSLCTSRSPISKSSELTAQSTRCILRRRRWVCCSSLNSAPSSTSFQELLQHADLRAHTVLACQRMARRPTKPVHAAQLLLQGHRWLGILDLTRAVAFCFSVPNIHRELAPLASLCAATETTTVRIAVLGLAVGEDLFQQERIGADRRWQPGPADHEPPEQTQAAWEVSVHYHTVKAANVQLVRARRTRDRPKTMAANYCTVSRFGALETSRTSSCPQLPCTR
ncbi:hypothetical protein U0070_020548 [Myodes glareolus]|uniref:Uncharacterized protein n=1 Tax=Myodes glareolus TaxID=447135 RepID=A0AAW0JAJ5_MYOGA